MLIFDPFTVQNAVFQIWFTITIGSLGNTAHTQLNCAHLFD